MITIRESFHIKDSIANRYTSKIYICPHCGNNVMFFDMCPTTCYSCMKRLTSGGRLIKDSSYRVDYHFGVA